MSLLLRNKIHVSKIQLKVTNKSPSPPFSSFKFLATSSSHHLIPLSTFPFYPNNPKCYTFPLISLSTPPNHPNFHFHFNFIPSSKLNKQPKNPNFNKSPQICLSTQPNSPNFNVNFNSKLSTQPKNPNFNSNSNFNFNFNSLSLSSNNPPPFQWHICNNNDEKNVKLNVKKNGNVTVVVLGWLGAGPRHLRRYVEMYNEMGFNAVTFVVPVKDVLVLGLGRGLEERVGEVAGSLAGWAEGGEEREVVFHTFSNTGWLAYGEILDNWRGRHDLLMKIKGCIVDSGAEAELDPKVWAAGFVTAVLKKRSSLTSSASTEIEKETNSEAGLSKTTDEPLLIESVLMAVFEKLFSFLFSLPDVSGRLRYVISTLTNSQPLCPQLYLYSTADKVIPFKSVEAFMEKQRKIGREVRSFNFGLSPHVDHYRTFPEIYSAQLLNFLQECLVTTKLS